MAKAVTINTKAAGRLSWTGYNKLVKGRTQAEVARDLGVAPSTVRNWGLRLRTKRSV